MFRTLKDVGPHQGGLWLASNGGNGLGAVFEGSIPGGDQVSYAIGLFLGPAPSWYLSKIGSQFVYGQNIGTDNQWHSFEMEFDRNAPNDRAEMRMWFDGQPIVMPAGTAWAVEDFQWNATWEGGNSGAGIPSTLYLTRQGTTEDFNQIFIMDTMSGTPSGGSGSMFIDDFAVSTQRIGP